MINREYDPEKDKEQCHRIWRDCGWLEKGKEEVMDTFIGGCRSLVGDVEGIPEALVLSSPGTIRYLNEDITMSAVCAVTTSYVGRKRGLAGRLTSEAVALDAAEGAEVSALGMFEQGYYNRLGYGAGTYDPWFDFDPADLLVDIKPPVPTRLTTDDWEAVHLSRLKRKLSHGSACLQRADLTKAEMAWAKNGFGLGYFDESGELTHHFWCGHEGGEHGPYFVPWMCYRDYCQFLGLLALIRGLGDQVHLIRINEPPAIQMQDLIRQPFKQRRITKGTRFAGKVHNSAYWQIRICDIEKCIGKTHLFGGEVRFNLRLSDPIVDYLDDDAPWKGISGEYTVVLGAESKTSRGMSGSLPLMEASVGAFTRMWFGVRPASGLAVTDDLAAPETLLEDLDGLLRLPVPRTDWEF